MRMRLPRTWVVCFVCLNTMACLRSLDSDKIPCTTSDRCPSNYTCVAGYCKRGLGPDSGTAFDATSVGDGPRSERGDAGLAATQPDSAAPTLNPDAYLPGTGGAGDAGLGGTSGGSGTIDAGGAAGSTGTGGTTGGIATGGAAGLSGGTAGTGTTSGIGGVTVTSLTTTTGGATLTTSTGGATLTTSNTVIGGTTASGGKGGASGGTTSSGGTTASGGSSTVVTGGTSSGGISAAGGSSSAVTGGSSATSSATCQPKARDCTSTLDNNCNGIPDNQETTYCACPVGQKRDCRDQYDGIGICKKGSQTCTASTDKTTSSWNDCSGFVAAATEVCDAAGLDENCDGRSNEGCECVNGASVPCECGPATTCTNGKKGTCSVTKVTLYRDSDNDGYGSSAQPALVCPGTSGYVSNSNDCDDTPGSGESFHPGVSICSSATQSKSCSATGVTSNTNCEYGCAGEGQCHPEAHGTIGLPGLVSCNVGRCSTSMGCSYSYSTLTCGTTESPGPIYCDGPNDCPGGLCCVYNGVGGMMSHCSTGACRDYYYPACDPLDNSPGCSCTPYIDYGNSPIYACR